MDKQIYLPITSPHPKKIAFVDIDSTLSNHIGDTTIPQLLDHRLTNKARAMLEERGFLVAFITSRTEEMLMSKEAYDRSVQMHGFQRPYALFDKENVPDGILDPDIIASSTGGKIFVHQLDGGYLEDVTYHKSPLSPTDWREQTISFLKTLQVNGALFSFSSIEIQQDFHKGATKVFPPDYRIQILFQNPHDLIDFKHRFAKYQPELYAINDSWPQEHKYALYISPIQGKFEAVNRILSMIEKDTDDQLYLPEVLFVGDSLPDVYEALFSTCALSTLFLVGGSRMSPYLLDPNMNDFAGDNVGIIKINMTKIETGTYQYKKNDRRCNIVISDEIYPGLVGPESLIEYLS